MFVTHWVTPSPLSADAPNLTSYWLLGQFQLLYFARFCFRRYNFSLHFSPRERCPDRELCPATAATAIAGAAFIIAAAAAPPAAAEQELGRVRGRRLRRRIRHLRIRHGAATAERQGEDHHGAHPRQRK